MGHDLPVAVVHIARRQAEAQDLPTVIDDKVELEAIEPPCGAFASLRDALKNLMLLYPMVVAYVQCCGVHKAYACAEGVGAHRLDKEGQGHGGIGHKLHKPVIADKPWEELTVFLLDKLCVIPFESPVAR